MPATRATLRKQRSSHEYGRTLTSQPLFGGSNVTLAAKPFKPAIFLALLAALSLAALAQEGGVSSNVTSHDASAPATSDSKPLPWKFLASPMGVLPTALASDPLSGACTADKPAVPSSAVEGLLKD